jgi:hypothetical protein
MKDALSGGKTPEVAPSAVYRALTLSSSRSESARLGSAALPVQR